METIKILGKEDHISFWGVPPEQFRAVFSELRKSLADNPHIRCVMLHHYGSLTTYLTNIPTKELKATNK